MAPLFLAVHRSPKWITVPSRFPGLSLLLEHWSSWGTHHRWIQGHVFEEKSLKKIFVCDSFCGQNVDLDREEGAGGATVARSLPCARSFAMLVSARSLVWRERESKLEKAAGEICSSGRPLFVFSLYYKDGGQLETSCFHQWCRRWFLWRTLLDHHISHFLCEVPCLFFGGLFVFLRSRIDFQKKLDEKHKKETSCPYMNVRATQSWLLLNVEDLFEPFHPFPVIFASGISDHYAVWPRWCASQHFGEPQIASPRSCNRNPCHSGSLRFDYLLIHHWAFLEVAWMSLHVIV